MSRLFLFLSIFILSVICLVTNIAKADETTTVVTPVTTPEGPAQQTTTTVVGPSGTVKRQVTITTPTPKAKEIIAAPEGGSCFNVEAGWYGNAWVPEHEVCNYTASKEGAAWVQGYWACTKYTAGTCTNWDWKAGHWVKETKVYY